MVTTMFEHVSTVVGVETVTGVVVTVIVVFTIVSPTVGMGEIYGNGSVVRTWGGTTTSTTVYTRSCLG